MRTLAWVLVSLLAQQAPRQPASVAGPAPTGTARLVGRVLAQDTKGPVRGASVVAVSEAGSIFTETGADGRFDLASLPSGHYRLRISKPVFLTTTFSASKDSSAAIDLADGQAVDRGDLLLLRGGVVAGRVFDTHGEAAAAVTVKVSRLVYTNPGVRRLVDSDTVETNDLGECRVYGLSPGRYFVSASMKRAQVAQRQAGSPTTDFRATSQGVAPTFFPGTAQATEAQLVAVAAGQVANGIDIALVPVPLATVSGTVVDSTGRSGAGMAVILNPARNDGASFFTALTSVTDAEGRFSIPNVGPGDYRIDLQSMARMKEIADSGRADRIAGGVAYEFASVPVTVAGSDVDRLTLRTGHGHTIKGRVTVDGNPITAEVATQVVVRAAPAFTTSGVSGLLLQVDANVDDKGEFLVNGLSGIRLIRPLALPRGTFLRDVRARGLDITDAGLDADIDDVVEVELRLTTHPATVSGVVQDEEGVRVRRGSVLIFSESAERWSTPLSRYVQTAEVSNGEFSIMGPPSGNYLIVAVSQLADGEWAEPANLEKLRATATAFKLGDGEHKALTLTIRRDR